MHWNNGISPMSHDAERSGGSDANPELTPWGKRVPWYLTVASAVTLIAIAAFLVSNIVWFRTKATTDVPVDAMVFRIHIYHMHLAMIKRSVGLFSGFALLFLGMSVALYHLRSRSRYRIGGTIGPQSFAAEAVSASPGVLAIVLGVVLLLGTIMSKDKFAPYYGEPSTVELPTPQPRQGDSSGPDTTCKEITEGESSSGS